MREISGCLLPWLKLPQQLPPGVDYPLFDCKCL
jgi:hypothetical protein